MLGGDPVATHRFLFTSLRLPRAKDGDSSAQRNLSGIRRPQVKEFIVCTENACIVRGRRSAPSDNLKWQLMLDVCRDRFFPRTGCRTPFDRVEHRLTTVAIFE